MLGTFPLEAPGCSFAERKKEIDLNFSRKPAIETWTDTYNYNFVEKVQLKAKLYFERVLFMPNLFNSKCFLRQITSR